MQKKILNVNVCVMSITSGKKEVVIGSKVSQELKDFIENLARREDRSASNIARSFLMRGLAHYYMDGHLRPTEEEMSFLDHPKRKEQDRHVVMYREPEGTIVDGPTVDKTLQSENLQKRRRAR